MRKYLLLFFVLFIVLSCKEKAPELPIELVYPTDIVHYDQTYQFIIKQGSNEFNNRDYKWELVNPKIGEIDANGLFTAKQVGESKVIVSKNGVNQFGDINLKVTPYSTLYTEPILTFGLTKDEMIKGEKRKLLTESETSMLYEGENSKVKNVLYLFKDKKLTSVVVLLQTTTEVATEASTFLKERYSYVGTQDNIYIFQDKGKVGVGISVDPSLGLSVAYIPDNSNKRASYEAEDFYSTFKESKTVIGSK